jgi:hypothetical protein
MIRSNGPLRDLPGEGNLGPGSRKAIARGRGGARRLHSELRVLRTEVLKNLRFPIFFSIKRVGAGRNTLLAELLSCSIGRWTFDPFGLRSGQAVERWTLISWLK